MNKKSENLAERLRLTLILEKAGRQMDLEELVAATGYDTKVVRSTLHQLERGGLVRSVFIHKDHRVWFVEAEEGA